MLLNMSAYKTPLVSAIVTVYNGEQFIERCVTAVLSQTYDNLEILVVDDGSTDNSAKIVRQFSGRVKLIQKSNEKVAVARQTALQHVHGDLIAFCDHDDTWHVEKIRRQVEFMRQHPEVALVHTDANESNVSTGAESLYWDSHRTISCKSATRFLKGLIVKQAVPLLSSFMFRAPVLKDGGIAFDSYPGGIDDVGVVLELVLAGHRIEFMPEALVVRQLHSGNWSSEYLRRFQLRVPMFELLLQKYGDRCSRRYCRLLRKGLGDAIYRVACEERRGDFDRKRMSALFWRAWRNDPANLRAFAKYIREVVTEQV